MKMKSIGEERDLFTIERANRTLPLVSRIVRDIVRANAKLWELHGQARSLIDEGRRGKSAELEDRMHLLAAERAGYIEELEKLGCELKDPDLGLVDFPARLDDRIVYLCWKLGETEITHWHEVHAGYPGRRPVRGLRFTC